MLGGGGGGGGGGCNSRNSSSGSINFGIILIFENTTPSSAGVKSLQIFVHAPKVLLTRPLSTTTE